MMISNFANNNEGDILTINDIRTLINLKNIPSKELLKVTRIQGFNEQCSRLIMEYLLEKKN
jgi:hypothetical protein